MVELDLAQVRAWALEAGEIAKGYFNRVSATFKADRTMVTAADREIEALLAARIRAAYPGHGLIGEEGARTRGSEVLWAIDPLDGTRAFVQGLPCWGTSIGVLERSRPSWGLFYMPLLDDWTYTDGPQGVYCNRRDLRGALRATWDDQSFLAVTSTANHDYRIDVPRSRALGSVAAGMTYVARGSAIGGFFHKCAIWDLAAGAAILFRAGAELCYLSGRAVDWAELADGRHIPEPVLAAHPALMPRLRASIHPWPGQ
jgi:myo-inositol-1(or 4)-monophosphatase